MFKCGEKGFDDLSKKKKKMDMMNRELTKSKDLYS